MTRDRSLGFTLLEIIATLVVVGIVASLAVSFFGVGVTRSDVVMNQLGTDTALQQAMENIIQDYVKNYSSNLTGLKTKLGAAGTTSTVYAVSGKSYYIQTNKYVMLSGTSFVDDTGTSQAYLLVTITPTSSQQNGLTYLFSKQ